MGLFKFLIRDQYEPLTVSIQRAGEANGLSNIFNVGIVEVNGTFHCLFRAMPANGQKPFRAYFIALQANGEFDNPILVDLTDHALQWGVTPVADPKPLMINGEVYVTFNTGQPSAGQQNEIFLMRVSPTLGAPQRCCLDEDRARVEKNWAFTWVDNELHALYSIAPLVSLRRISGALNTHEDLIFTRVVRPRLGSRPGVALSIGTQLTHSGSTFSFICHEKIGIRSRRAYFGRLARVRFTDGRFADLEISRVRLLHSFRHALPHRPKHNRALISATYFSGVQFSEGYALLGYGINDVDFSVAKVKESALWE